MHLLVNILFAILAFFVVRWLGSLVMPNGQDKGNVINVIAVIVAIVVFLTNFASQIKGLK